MKSCIKKIYIFCINNAIKSFFNLSVFINYKFKGVFIDIVSDFINNNKESVFYNDLNINFFTPSSTCLYRSDTFSTKEPETLEWINEFGGQGKVMYDIGANIGLYSIYNSLKGGKTFSFEPSFFNLSVLSRNIVENNCQDSIAVVTNPLSSKNEIQEFKYGGYDIGGACSSFGVDYGFDGETLETGILNHKLGLSLDFILEKGLINTYPNLIKLDVDGIEHIILRGARKTLRSMELKSILVELNPKFKEQYKETHEILSHEGFVLRNKFPNALADKSSKFYNCGNEIWIRK